MLVYFKGATGDPGGQGLPGEMGVKVGISHSLLIQLTLGPRLASQSESLSVMVFS